MSNYIRCLLGLHTFSDWIEYRAHAYTDAVTRFRSCGCCKKTQEIVGGK